MNIDDFDPPLDPDAEALAYKLQSYLKSKSGNLLELMTLNHKQDRYYWCIMSKNLFWSMVTVKCTFFRGKETTKDSVMFMHRILLRKELFFLYQKKK